MLIAPFTGTQVMAAHRISATNRVSFLGPVSPARRKLEQRRSRVLPSLLALLTDRPPGEIVHALAADALNPLVGAPDDWATVARPAA
jgi:hypothetical protein